MRLLALPTPPAGVRFWRVTVTLEGVDYQFSFSFNERDPAWYLNIAATDGTALINGIRLSTGIELLEQYAIQGMPPGSLFLADLQEEDHDAGADDLGTRVILLYLEAE